MPLAAIFIAPSALRLNFAKFEKNAPRAHKKHADAPTH
jgi:hypothetical protein